MNECEIFIAALDKSVLNEREAFLEQACGGNAELRQRIESLLESHGQAGSLLEHPALGAAATALLEQSEVSTDGSAIFSARQVMLPDEFPLDFLAPSEDPQALGCLGPYTVTARIGRGGMGVVLKAQDAKLNRVVAIKVMAPELASNTTAKMRFVREARATASVVHQHVVTIHAVDEDRLPYLVMEYIDGQSLQEKIDREGYLELTEILRIGQQVASGLAAAHAHGLTHRDVKPANILLENSVERVRITDFGLARVADDASTSQTGLIAGTPQYMSPEQARGEIIDSRSDLFSLGSTLYAMCTGRAPFRAANSIAVLKRVCEDRPSPIQEANPDIPQCLVDLIDKLQAKDPAERVQSAGEVAEQLRQYLAGELDTAGIPAVGKPPRTSRGKRRRWALAAAAAVLLCLAGAMSLTEATGVTQVMPTVISFFTGEGTLVVETDPDVQVSLEGNGDLVFNLAGGQTIRIPSGRYGVKATKDGKPVPLENDRVTISRGGREIVKVKRLETPPVPPPPPAERGAVVLLAAGKVRKFDTLAEAVLTAIDGDIIEIRGNGPFDTEPIQAGKQVLTIRAGAGFRPVIRLSPKGLQTYEPMLLTSGVLVLEGLEFQRLGQKWSPGEPPTRIVSSDGSALRVANCRFRRDHTPGANFDHIQNGARFCEIRNCEFLSPVSVSIGLTNGITKTVILDNCVHVGRVALSLFSSSGDPVEVRLNRNTLVARECQAIHFGFPTQLELGTDTLALRPAIIEATGNVFDVLFIMNLDEYGKVPPREPDDAESILRRVMSWQGRYNVYEVREHFLSRYYLSMELPPHGPKDLAGWKTFWDSPEIGSSVGAVRFQGGDLAHRLMTAPEKLMPVDFRLRPDSAGYRAGKDGKDLGADVDLVGPGPAYERWKNTPEYEEWLKETGQKK